MQDSPGGEIKVVILGAGIGGLACALALRARGLGCVVYERAPELREIGAGLLLTPNACAVLAGLGITERLAGRSIATTRWGILDPRGRVLQEVGLFPPESGALSTRRSDLQSALRAAAGDDVIRLGHEARAIGVGERAATIRFGNGAVVEADLVIAADGADSLARRTFWPGRGLRDQGYVGWRAVVDGVPPGWEDGWVTESWGRGLRFGIAAVGQERTYWYATANHGAAGDDDPARRRERLLQIFRGWHAPVRALIHATPSALILRHAIADAHPAGRLSVGGRLALLGDAAHPLTPNLGQGAAMALEDAWELARCLATAPDPASALSRYERRRLGRVALIWALSNGLGRLIQSEHAGVTALRDAGMRATPRAVAWASLQALLVDPARSPDVPDRLR